MKPFCRKLALFLALQGVGLGVIVSRFDSARETNYLAATCDKHAQLQRTVPPRIILVGGSNLAFGIDSPRLSWALGRDVVNMGLVAGLGLDFMLNEIASAIQPNDVVVLSLEYDRFSGGYNPLTLQQIIQYRPESLMYLETRQCNRVLIRGGLSILGGIVRRALGIAHAELPADLATSPVYIRSGFNRWGDMTNHYGQPGTMHWPAGTTLDRLRSSWLPSPAIESHLRRFARQCARQQAAFVFSCPPQPRDILNAERETIDAILKHLSEVPGLVVLDSPDGQVYPDSLFFDTGYHLTRDGAEQRTDRLSASLRRVLDAK